MQEQAVYFDERTNAKRIRVMKVYDTLYARSCFEEMDDDALAFLSKSLDLENQYEESGSRSFTELQSAEAKPRPTAETYYRNIRVTARSRPQPYQPVEF
jgi:hypothetical protein